MKKIISVVFIILIATSVFCEEWEFIVTEDTQIFSIISPGALNQGTRILSTGYAIYGERDRKIIPFLRFIPEELFNFDTNRVYSINGRNAIPAATVDLFGSDILTISKNFLISYCLDVLISKDRNTVLKYELYFKNNQIFDDTFIPFTYWYDVYDAFWFSFLVSNTVIGFGGSWALIINNIEKTEYGYKIRCRESTENYHPGYINVPTLEWEWGVSEKRQEVDLLIHFDGDYIDIFVNNTNTKVGTFVSVSDELIRQFNNLLKTNTCDLTNVTWPRRADGSMDYPPPAGVDLSRTNDEIISDIETADNIVSHKSTMAQDSTENNTLPLPLLLAIIGGVAVIIGVVVVVVLRKKK